VNIVNKLSQNISYLSFFFSLLLTSLIWLIVILFFIQIGVLPDPPLFIFYWFFTLLIYHFGGIILAKFQTYDAEKNFDNSTFSGLSTSEEPFHEFPRKKYSIRFSNFCVDVITYMKSYGEIIAFYSLAYYFYYINKAWSSANIQTNIDLNKPHVGIIVNHYHTYFGKEYCYGFGVDLLIESFNNDILYSIYPCETKKRFLEIISNPFITNVWIFGHGNHGTILCGDGKFTYQDLFNQLPKGFRPKDAIYQMHCNDGKQTSLVELLSNGSGFVNDTKNTMFGLRYYTRKILDKTAKGN